MLARIRFAPWLLLAAALPALAANAGSPALDRGPGYAASTWASVHGDSSNSDYVPVETSVGMAQAWRALDGAGIWTAPSVAANGTIFVTTGRGPGFPHLHALAPDGSLRWESTPQKT